MPQNEPFIISDPVKIAHDTRYMRRDEIGNFPPFSPSKFAFFYDDFIHFPTSNVQWVFSLSGNGTLLDTTANAGEQGRPGLLQFRVVSNSTNYIQINAGSNYPVLFGGGSIIYEASYKLPTATSVANLKIFFGFLDVDGDDAVDGAYFKYTSGSNGNNWQALTSNNSSRTTTTLSAPANDTNWHKLKIVVNSDATSVAFYFDDVLVATHTDNIPSATGRETDIVVDFASVSGTSATFTMLVDYVFFLQALDR